MTGKAGIAREAVAAAVRDMVLQVLPEVSAADVVEERSLVALGATSIDRVEVALGAMEALGLVMRPAELAGVGTIGGLIDVLFARASA